MARKIIMTGSRKLQIKNKEIRRRHLKTEIILVLETSAIGDLLNAVKDVK